MPKGFTLGLGPNTHSSMWHPRCQTFRPAWRQHGELFLGSNYQHGSYWAHFLDNEPFYRWSMKRFILFTKLSPQEHGDFKANLITLHVTRLGPKKSIKLVQNRGINAQQLGQLRAMYKDTLSNHSNELYCVYPARQRQSTNVWGG